MAKKRPRINLSQRPTPYSDELNKLFTAPEDVEQASGMQLLAVHIDAIQPDPDQPRSTFPSESLEELSASIAQDGVIQPIEVVEIRPNVYMIVHGERRWRAARMAGLETMPAVVRRRDYDVLTRFVRQIVENMQREDLNDVDRAAGMIRLRDLMQEELDQAHEEDIPSDTPWAKKMTWAKVGERLGYSRQRIHQLIKLLDLPDEIKEAVRNGELTERETRVYQGLRPSQQRALHRARIAGDLDAKEVREVARLLKELPNMTVHQAMRLLADPSLRIEPAVKAATENTVSPHPTQALPPGEGLDVNDPTPSTIQRLTWVRGHLHRVHPQAHSAAERQEIMRLLRLIEEDVESLLNALQ
ncbi:MAG: ParB/RepB/Spo0J family partition protein [Candidatus Promineifilaceae bacterium]